MSPVVPVFVLVVLASTVSDSGYVRSIETWRRQRTQELKKPDGWFSLAGLFWLRDGENSFGAAPSNRIAFPAGKAPARAGSFVVGNGHVIVRVEPGVAITAAGKPVRSMELRSDETGAPTVLALGSLRFHVIRRGEKLAVRLKDLDSPERARFTGIDHFPVDPAWRVEARFERYDPPRNIPIANTVGMMIDQVSPGTAVFERRGREFRLDAIEEKGSDELFFVFGDSTNGRETYGGGRFLYSAKPDSSGRVTLDFNKTENPPCAFTPFATCPLPPEQNRLALRVTAGEKSYGHHSTR